MAVDTFIPEVWNARLITALDSTLVLGDGTCINRDYEGDIAQAGDTVHINHIADPAIKDYVKNVTVISPDTLTTTEQTLTIDQCKYYAIEVDDVDKRQALNGGALLATAATRAAYQLRKAADTFVGARMVAGAGENMGAVTLNATTASTNDLYEFILELRTHFDDTDIPDEGRFIVGSADFVNSLAYDPRFTDASKYGSNRLITNGEVGSILGFTIKKSTNLPAGATTGTYVVAGTSAGMTFAQQISKSEAYRPESSFSDAIKGLHLYGGKVVRPEFLAVADVTVTHV